MTRRRRLTSGFTLLGMAIAGGCRAVGAQRAPRTFGSGVIVMLRNATFQPVVVLDHTLSPDAAHGVVTHFWTTGEIINDRIVLDYFVDDETSPSISMQPAMASGQGFARQLGNIGGGDDAPSHGVYSAGGRMGKSAQIGGWYNYHKVLFQRRILITARTLDSAQVAYLNTRGYEVPSTLPESVGLRMPSGQVVPPHAKLQLMRVDNVSFAPLSFVPLLTLPPGYTGLLYLVSIATTTTPAGNDYIEGCWHLYTDSNQCFPGVVVGTGLEDFFDSAYWFCALNGQEPCLFAQPATGVLHFARVWANGTAMSLAEQKGARPFPQGTREEVGAYRLFDSEVVAFRDGGSLQWRVGDSPDKCTEASEAEPLGDVRAVSVRSYAWAYTWPINPADPPAPNAPPLQCGDPSVCGPSFPNPGALPSPPVEVPVLRSGVVERAERSAGSDVLV